MSSFEILHCAETVKGGVATYLKELLPLQVGFFGLGKVSLIIPKSQSIEIIPIDGVNIHTYDDCNNRVLNSLKLAQKVKQVLQERSINIVHVHSTFAGVTVRPLSRLFFKKVKVIYCPHGWAWDRPMSAFKRKLTIITEKILSLLCWKIICISQHEKNTALSIGIKESKLIVVLNGISSNVEKSSRKSLSSAWPPGDKKLLFVGRFDNQKGVDIFCDALRILGSKASGLLVGDYVLGDSTPINISENTRQVSWVKQHELQTLDTSADILIVPSRWEGFGLVAVEAMRAGLPVIASDVGGLPEIINNNITGILIPPNSVETLVSTIKSLDAYRLESMGQAGKIRFNEKFIIDRVHRELLDIYSN